MMTLDPGRVNDLIRDLHHEFGNPTLVERDRMTDATMVYYPDPSFAHRADPSSKCDLCLGVGRLLEIRVDGVAGQMGPAVKVDYHSIPCPRCSENEKKDKKGSVWGGCLKPGPILKSGEKTRCTRRKGHPGKHHMELRSGVRQVWSD